MVDLTDNAWEEMLLQRIIDLETKMKEVLVLLQRTEDWKVLVTKLIDENEALRLAAAPMPPAKNKIVI